MILDDLKAFFIANNLATSAEIKFDFDSSTANCVTLWNYGSVPSDLGSRPTIQIQVKNADMAVARNKIQAIYNALYPIDQFAKAIVINNKTMHIKPNQEPFFNEKDATGRFCYIFNITVTQNR